MKGLKMASVQVNSLNGAQELGASFANLSQTRLDALNDYQVVKRDGSIEALMIEKIISCLQRTCADFGSTMLPELILEEVIINLFHQIKTYEVLYILILSSAALIEKDPIYSKVAARFLLQKTYKNVFGAAL